MLPLPSTDMPKVCATFKGCTLCRQASRLGAAVRGRYSEKYFSGQDLQDCPFGRGAVGARVELPPSRGLGDTVAKLAAPVAELFGIGDDCGCAERQAKLNELFPYKSADLPPKLG